MLPSVSIIGQTKFRASSTVFGIKQPDRLSHVYMIGKTGVGKSSLMEMLALQDLAAGRGFALIDPHGDLVERVNAAVPGTLRGRVHYLNAPDATQPFGYNPLRRVRPDKAALAASGLLEAMRKLWPLAWGVRMEHVLRNSLLALLTRDGSTLVDVLRLYSDKHFRREVVAHIENPVVRAFWRYEFAAYTPRQLAEVVAPIQNKLGALLSDPTLYRILVNPETDLHFRRIMDDGQIVLVNLSKGQLGEDAASMLGSLLVSTIGLAAFTRSETADRRPFFLYVDEFQTFTTLSFATMMPEARKYGLGLILAHQYLHQLEPDVRHAVLGNAGTIISFRIGSDDAATFAREFSPTFTEHDLLNLANRDFYIKLMIYGTPSRPFSAHTV